MSPEQAHALLNRIALLRQMGEKIGEELSQAKLSQAEVPEIDVSQGHYLADYKIESWFGEVEALVKKNFGNNSSIVARADELKLDVEMPPPGEPGSVPTPLDTLDTKDRLNKKALDLLNTVEEFVFVDPLNAASEPLKNLIEQTLRERYFKSTEVRVLVALFAFVTALFFGGTIYLGWQVKGVAAKADAARTSIALERKSVVTIGNEVIRRIEATTKEEAAIQIAELRATIKLSKESIISLKTQLGTNHASLNQLFTHGRTQINDAVEKAIADAPSHASVYLESKQPMIDKAVTELVEDARKQVQEKIQLVNVQKQNFEDALPDIAIYAENRVKEFNDIVSRYSGRIDKILPRFSGSEKLPAIQAVSRVLGNAFELTLAAVGFSVLAIGMSILALIRGRKARLVHILK